MILFFFIYLNKKQNSRDGIKKYFDKDIDREQLIKNISEITKQIISAQSLEKFEDLLYKHENEISKALNTPTIKSTLFSDYPRVVKSLGAWGGDFILVIGKETDMEYFRQKGYNTIIPYTKMILQKKP